jgi:hypothetical protein
MISDMLAGLTVIHWDCPPFVSLFGMPVSIATLSGPFLWLW